MRAAASRSRRDAIHLAEAVRRVLRLPAVADKTFLITIGDRTVGGLVARDQMVGPWQVPVADAAVTATSFDVTTGEAMAMGERAPVALLDAAASARLAIAEAITNIASAPIARLSRHQAVGELDGGRRPPGRGRAPLRRRARRGRRALPRAGHRDPRRQGLDVDAHDVDRARREPQRHRAAVADRQRVRARTDVRRALTPELWRRRDDAGELLLVDLGRGKNRLGGSALAQVYGQLGATPPDLDDPALLRGFFAAVQELSARRRRCSRTTIAATAACS